MAELTQAMKDIIASQQCFIATVNEDGTPNVGPKRSTRVLNDTTLIFNEGTAGSTYRNVLAGSKVAIAVVDREVNDGYRFVGKPEVLTEGEVYEQAAEMSVKMGRLKPAAVVLVHLEQIHSLKPGPGAGKPV